jgi:Lrp/AsnC family transcriptional regulator for asnA, asnC and gidA
MTNREVVKMNSIDQLDRGIITMLEQNAYHNIGIVARNLNTSSATVRRRINKLIKNDVIHIIAMANYEKLGHPLNAIISLDVEQSRITSTTEFLGKCKEVTWVATTTGRFDITMIARFKDANELSAFTEQVLPRIDGLKNSETSICLRRKAQSYGWQET